MNAFTIKDLENLSGIKAHTIRIWEQRYSFLKPQRTETNIRFYNNDELRTILNVALLNKYGFKISHIDKMDELEMKDKILSLSNSQAQQERIINDLIQRMIEVNIDIFEDTLNKYIHARGIEKAITQIIFPFLERIGILWMTQHVNPAQEHLVTNLIRQKIILGIDSIHQHIQVNRSVLVFLPEGEHHELGLLFIYYLLKNRGLKVWYLGANVPLKDVEFIIKLKQPTIAYTHLTSMAANFNMDKFLQQAATKLHGTPLVVSGQLTQGYKKKAPNNISLKQSLSEVMEYITTL